MEWKTTWNDPLTSYVAAFDILIRGSENTQDVWRNRPRHHWSRLPSLTGTKKDAMIFITFCIRIHNSIAALAEMRFIGRQMLSKSGVL